MEDLEGVVWEKSQDKLGPMLLFCFFFFLFFSLVLFFDCVCSNFPGNLLSMKEEICNFAAKEHKPDVTQPEY